MGQNREQQCIDAIVNGDTQAFSVLVDRYKHMVFTLAMKVLGHREEAEEVAQDVFLKAYQALPSFKGDSKFSTWLYKIAYNKSLDYAKRNGRYLKTTSLDASVELHVPSLDNTLEGLEANDRRTTIKRAMADLPENDAVVITLHYFEELSLKEISEVMGISPNTVKVRLFRSRKRLAVLLKNKLEPETIKGYGRK